jgi:photosystem II stability/assembly factor-like uncharacterized protein
MSSRVLVLVGTKKGAFMLQGAADRGDWQMRGPFCETWPVRHLAWDPEHRALLAGTANAWYGASVWRSTDLGETWSQSSDGLTYGEDGPKITAVWNLTPGIDGSIWAGVEPAGLFRSTDGGVTWSHVEGLTNHPTRSEWQPGNGGLILHSIAPHPTDPNHVWVGISSVGAFETTDGGTSWQTRNHGVRADFFPGEPPEFGQCVHKMTLHPGRPGMLFQQNHCGVYRSDNGGEQWTEITSGLPSDFGFPLAIHPHDPQTIYVIPLTPPDKGRYMPDGQTAVYRSRDDGASWERLTRGLPDQGAYVGVLREAMATDALDPAGIYFGTSTGQVFASSDEGDSWRLIADYLPSISSIETITLDA